MNVYLKYRGGLLAAVLLSCAIVGCSKKPASPPAAKGPEMSAEAEAAIAENLAKLSPEDRELAAKQKVCPISEHPLGSATMGVPIKLDVKGHAVFICCEGCRDAVLSEPDKYLAKLGITDGPAAEK
jgi:hypothetical protein